MSLKQGQMFKGKSINQLNYGCMHACMGIIKLIIIIYYLYVYHSFFFCLSTARFSLYFYSKII